METVFFEDIIDLLDRPQFTKEDREKADKIIEWLRSYPSTKEPKYVELAFDVARGESVFIRLDEETAQQIKEYLDEGKDIQKVFIDWYEA